MAEDAAIPPSPKRQADPAAGEEDRDAKKLKQGKKDVKKMMEDFKAEYDENADEQAVLDLVAKFKDEYNVRPSEAIEGIPDQPDYNPEDPLPKGHVWASFYPGGTSKDYVYKLKCAYCGKCLDHWTKDCPRKSEFKGKAKSESESQT